MPERTKYAPGTPSWIDLTTSPAEGIPAHCGVYFCVDDTDALVEQAKGLGAIDFAEPTDIPPGRFATLTDPQGAMFNVLTWSEPTD